jgi:hypothetical protein
MPLIVTTRFRGTEEVEGRELFFINELKGFGWYLWLISKSSALMQYCDDNGFEEIDIAIKRLKRIWD